MLRIVVLLVLIFGTFSLYAQNGCGSVAISLTSDDQFAMGTSGGGSAFRWTENGQTIEQGSIPQLTLFHFDSALPSTSGISATRAVGTSFVPGKWGTALAVATGGNLTYPAAGNISFTDGTIEMWVATRSDGTAPIYAQYDHTLLRYTSANGDQLVFSESAGGGFYGGTVVGKSFTGTGSGGSAGAISAWLAGEWHHLALTYSSRQSRLWLYVDGQVAGQIQGPLPMPAADGPSFTIDSDAYGNASAFLIDELRVSNAEKTPAEIQYDFSRNTPFENDEVLLPLTGLPAGQLAYSVTQAGSTTSCGNVAAAYLGIPIINPMPASTLLPPGATSVSLSVQTPAATSCGYSVNTQLSYSALTSFDKGQGSTTHTTMIQGLSPDPSQTNDVYVSCAIASDYVTHLQYRAVPLPSQSFPRVASIFAQSYALANPNRARYALWGLSGVPVAAVTQLRKANPNVVVLYQIGVLDEDLANLPESYYLHDVNGNRIAGWPGQFYTNMTNPAAQQYKASLCYQDIVSNNMMYDGCFFDTFQYPQIPNQLADYLGNVHLVDAFGTGQQTDQQTLNTSWRAGMLAMMADFRQLMPGAYALGHLGALDADLAAAFNGDALIFMATDVLEGRSPFFGLLQRYNGWWNLRGSTAMTIVESTPQTQIAYGYGVYPDFTGLLKAMPPGVLTFAQDFYPYMRLPLAVALMNDGYFDRELGDISYGYTNWWYDEYDFNLGWPVGPSQHAAQPIQTNLIKNGGFESPLTGTWQLDVFNDGQGKATVGLDESIAADGNASVHIAISSVATVYWHIGLEQGNLPLTAGGGYQVQFWARASTPRVIALQTQGGAPDYPNYGLFNQIAIGTSWQLYSASFTAPVTASDGRLEFWLGDIAGDVWLDDVQITPPSIDVYRRDFTNGVVLLNGTASAQTISLEPGLQRFKGTQAPRYQYIVDDSASASPDAAGFSSTGPWITVTIDSGTRIDDAPLSLGANPPFYHCWQSTCHQLGAAGGTAQWNLNIAEDGQYTIQAWLPAAPNASTFAKNAIYEIVSGGDVIASATIDQTSAGAADGWHMIGVFNLTAAGAPFVRLHNGGLGSLIADAVYVTSAALYNDGSPAPQVTIAPLDGLLLQRQQPLSVPTSRVNAVVNAAGFQASISAAGFVSIGGSGFGTTTREWASADFSGANLPTMLDGISVTINGKPAYIEYISSTQINAIAPDDATIGTVPVQVTTPQGVSYAVTALKQKLSPAFFTYSSGTTNYAVAVHLDGTLVGPTGPSLRPAAPGEVIEIFGTGFGTTNPVTPTAQLVTQPAPLAVPATAAIGGAMAEVQWAGLVSPGLYQFNVKVPNIASGDQQLQATAGGFQSPATVMLSIAGQ